MAVRRLGVHEARSRRRPEDRGSSGAGHGHGGEGAEATALGGRGDRTGAEGRRGAEAPGEKAPELIARIEELMKHDVAGDPITGVKWTRRTTRKIAKELFAAGIQVNDVRANRGTVYVGTSCDTPGFAAENLARWWETEGRQDLGCRDGNPRHRSPRDPTASQLHNPTAILKGRKQGVIPARAPRDAAALESRSYSCAAPRIHRTVAATRKDAVAVSLQSRDYSEWIASGRSAPSMIR